MILFKERKELEKQYYSWLRKHPEIDNNAFSVITFLCTIKRLKSKDEKWIPFTLHYDEEEKKEMLNCKLPDEDEEILVTYKNGYVGEDIFLLDGTECYLDSNREFVTEAIAWMHKPQPYIGE